MAICYSTVTQHGHAVPVPIDVISYEYKTSRLPKSIRTYICSLLKSRLVGMWPKPSTSWSCHFLPLVTHLLLVFSLLALFPSRPLCNVPSPLFPHPYAWSVISVSSSKSALYIASSLPLLLSNLYNLYPSSSLDIARCTPLSTSKLSFFPPHIFPLVYPFLSLSISPPIPGLLADFGYIHHILPSVFYLASAKSNYAIFVYQI